MLRSVLEESRLGLQAFGCHRSSFGVCCALFGGLSQLPGLGIRVVGEDTSCVYWG